MNGRARNSSASNSGKGTFLARQIRRSAIGRLAQCRKPFLDQHDTFGRAVFGTAKDQSIRKARDAQSDAALGHRFGALRFERKARNVDDIVEQTYGCARQAVKRFYIQFRVLFERMLDQLGKIDRSQ